MDVNVNQWNGTENEVVEEMSLQRKRVLKKSSSSSSSDSDRENKVSEHKDGGLDLETISKTEVTETQMKAEIILKHKDNGNGTILPASDSPLLEDSPRLSNVTNNERRTVIIIKENDHETQEFYLERVFEKPPTHGFYCPNCRACIEKVYIQKQEESIRCSSCLSFLIPIGSWLFPGLIRPEGGAPNEAGSSSNNAKLEDPKKPIEAASKPEEVSKPVAKGPTSGNQTLQIIEEKDDGTGIPVNDSKSQDSSVTLLNPGKGKSGTNWAVIRDSSGDTTQKDSPGTLLNPGKGGPGTSWAVIRDTSGDITHKQPGTGQVLEVKVVEPSTGQDKGEDTSNVTDRTPPNLPGRQPPVPASSKTFEILKSVVYGGLMETLASLSVVTSAASADATTLNIIALAIANMIGGLFTLGHNLKELKADEPKRSNTDVLPVDRYNELLGQRENFTLHAFFAILSFIIFGLVPPVVYGLSFHESDEKDFKLAAVAGASVLCITLLSIAKAYTNRSNTYFQTVVYYVSTGAVASVLSYLAGDLVKKLIEKLGWFEPAASGFAKGIPGSSTVQQAGWGSY